MFAKEGYVMMKYWSFLLLVVVFCLGLVVTGTVEGSSKRDEAVRLLKEAQSGTVGEKYVAYGNVICLVEAGHKHQAGKALNTLMADEADSAVLDMVSNAYFVLELNPRPEAGGVYTNISGFVYTISASGNKTKATGTVYFWNELRTILLHKFPATASAGYAGRIWVQRYDCRALATAIGKYSAWMDNYLPTYPTATLNFRVYQ